MKMRRVTNNRYTRGRRPVDIRAAAKSRAEKVEMLTFVEREPRVAEVNARFPHNTLANMFFAGFLDRDPADRSKYVVTAAGKAWLRRIAEEEET